MPILETPLSNALLDQGDLLSGIRLFATDNTWEEAGGDAAKAPFGFCLVISRPCVCAQKERIIVAGVETYQSVEPRELLQSGSFETVLNFLVLLRDGSARPDQFYLGQLPGKAGRYCARLDSLHTIRIPTGDRLAEFLKHRRIARLNPEFCRALHTRIFTGFASLGYDDHAWLSDDDLEWLVSVGKQEVTAAEAKVAGETSKQRGSRAAGKTPNQKDHELASKNLDALRQQVLPYEQEFQRRKEGQASPTSGV